tara:strand:- start:2097 stop:2891 length:795 start_codon:yes stop_codon:yes gene_type:complete
MTDDLQDIFKKNPQWRDISLPPEMYAMIQSLLNSRGLGAGIENEVTAIAKLLKDQVPDPTGVLDKFIEDEKNRARNQIRRLRRLYADEETNIAIPKKVLIFEIKFAVTMMDYRANRIDDLPFEDELTGEQFDWSDLRDERDENNATNRNIHKHLEIRASTVGLTSQDHLFHNFVENKDKPNLKGKASSKDNPYGTKFKDDINNCLRNFDKDFNRESFVITEFAPPRNTMSNANLSFERFLDIYHRVQTAFNPVNAKIEIDKMYK